MSIRETAPGRKFLISAIVVVIAVLIIAGKLFLDAIYVPVILMYHSVGKEIKTLDGSESKLNVSPRAFAKQMKFLYEHDYKVISLVEFIERIKRRERIPPKTIAITFDDGLRNNFFYAYPALKRYSFPATIFVATDFIGGGKFLTWDDINVMQEFGVLAESHTMSHPWLPDLDEVNIRKEFAGSKRIIEKMTGHEVKTLSYPLGAFNGRIEKIAKETGYIGAVATSPGRKYPNDDPYALKRTRISMSANNLFVFWIKTSGYHLFVKERRDED